MFPLIFCSLCAQIFWCVRTFLEMTNILFMQNLMHMICLYACAQSLKAVCAPKRAQLRGNIGHMWQNAFYRYLKWTFEDLLTCFCYAIKTYSRTNRSQVWPDASASIGKDRSELHAHQCITPKQWTWLACSVSVILVHNLPLQELNQLIGIELLISAFLENFLS